MYIDSSRQTISICRKLQLGRVCMCVCVKAIALQFLELSWLCSPVRGKACAQLTKSATWFQQLRPKLNEILKLKNENNSIF